MEEMASLWSYQESVDETKLRIHYTALELEAVKAKATEEMNSNNESVKKLLHLLKLVCNERDEARDQIQKLLIKIMPSINNSLISDYFVTDQVHQHQHSPLMKPAKANSSIAESNSLSDAYNHSSSPVDSLFDPVTSPDFSNINTNTCFVQDYHHEEIFRFHAVESVQKIDHATIMMESMIKGKALPQKGNLLQAVMEAGPLLQTRLAARPLPSWQNLSPLQSSGIPPVPGSIGAQNQMTMMAKQSMSFVEMPCAVGSSILNFDDVKLSNFGPLQKRERFQ